MRGGYADGRLSFLGMRGARGFALRVMALPPGDQRPYVDEEWSGTLVVVECGTVELESLSGARRLFVRGDVLALDRVALRTLRNHGPVTALLSAVSRGEPVGPGSRPDRERPIPFPGAGV